MCKGRPAAVLVVCGERGLCGGCVVCAVCVCVQKQAGCCGRSGVQWKEVAVVSMKVMVAK